MSDPNLRAIAFYLPQFHPLPENDEWWGPGFTEWTNTAMARPLFAGHEQPKIPGKLGFYDLRLSDSRLDQAKLAREHGISGFCYWHYWFAGRTILERPFDEVLRSGDPDFPFCLAWANETWTGIWHGLSKKILIEQTYPGIDDHRRHFEALLPAFKDRRYILVDGRPLFLIYHPDLIPNFKEVVESWRKWAIDAGLSGLYLVGCKMNDSETWQVSDFGLDALNGPALNRALIPMRKSLFRRITNKVLRRPPNAFPYREATRLMLKATRAVRGEIPTLLPNWDNSPRSSRRAVILHGWTPEHFRTYLRDFLQMLRDNRSPHGLFFVKSWNEWAEGNYLEPDRRHGDAALRVFSEEMSKWSRSPSNEG